MCTLGALCLPNAGQAQETSGWSLSEEGAERYALDVWTIEDGLPQSTVNDLVQTRDGYLWLATFGGLTRFDGVRFEVFDGTTPLGLSGNRVVSVYEDSRGVLWIGFETSGIGRLVDGRFEAVPPSDDSPVGVVWDIDEDVAGNVWFATSRQLLIYSESAGLRRLDYPSPDFSTPRAISRDGSAMWIGTGRPELARFEVDGAGVPALDTVIVDFRAALPFGVHRQQDGRLWVATSAGVLSAAEGESLVPAAASGANMASVLAGARGELWFLGSTVLKLGPNIDSLGDLAPVSPLGAEVGYAALGGVVDREGNLWVGTRGGGLLRLRPKRVKRFRPFLTESNGIGALAADPSGGLWVSVECGPALQRFREGRFQEVTPPIAVCQDGSLAADPTGALVTRRAGAGVGLSTSAGFEPILAGPDQAITSDGQGTVWISSPRGLSSWAGDSVVTHLSLDAGAEPLPTRELVATSDGSIWFLGRSRLARWQSGDLDRYFPSDGLPDADIRALHRDDDGGVWIGSYGRGLARLVGDDFVSYTVQDGLADNFVLQILEDEAGNLWMNGNRSLSYVHRDLLNSYADGETKRLFPVAYGPRDGFAEGNSSQKGALKSADGRLWFSSIDGLMMVDPPDWLANTLPPPITIELFSAGDSVYGSDDIRVPPRTRNLEFRYTALSLGRPERIHFRYMLEGYDEDWVEAGSRRTAFYSGVPPGPYLFRVIASNDEGVWNETGTSMRFTLLPSFWVTWWFVSLSAGLSLLLLNGVYRVRTRSIRHHAWALQAEIDERTRVEGEREELEAQLRQSQKLEAVGQLTGGVAHDFNNLLTVILGNLDLAREMATDAEGAALIGRAMDASLRGAALTQRLLAFSRKQPLRPTAVDLAELVAGMDDLLRRSLGESIDIETGGMRGLWKCEADATQLESVILNLAINARDAMPDGGKLMLEAANVPLDSIQAEPQLEGARDPYVVLAVKDTGIGMTREILSKAFDPFFTTKEVGHGSGLGLSMVFGFAKQSGGHVTIDSAPGRGTIVRVYLPRAGANAVAKASDPDSDVILDGADRLILVVEDDRDVRKLTVRLLSALGYRTLEASNGDEAVAHLERNRDIALLFTDVVLRGGETGADVAERVRLRIPDIPVLFTSGYAEHAIFHHGRLDRGVDLLEKPFTKMQLAARVGAAIRGRSPLDDTRAASES